MLNPRAHFGSGLLLKVTPPTYPWLHTATATPPPPSHHGCFCPFFSLEVRKAVQKVQFKSGD